MLYRHLVRSVRGVGGASSIDMRKILSHARHPSYRCEISPTLNVFSVLGTGTARLSGTSVLQRVAGQKNDVHRTSVQSGGPGVITERGLNFARPITARCNCAP